MIRISQLKIRVGSTAKELEQNITSRLRIKKEDLVSYEIIRHSIDARDKDNIRSVYTIDVNLKSEDRVLKHFSKDKDISPAVKIKYEHLHFGTRKMNSSPCIIGSGPAGLFCAYFLAKYGYKPVLIEQGECVENRIKTVNAFWDNKAPLDPLSNIQFGEGGAGTFSDGKLMSGVKDVSGRKTLVLETFVENGAQKHILYNTKPHVGTDVLSKVIVNMRKQIEQWGGQVLFNTKFTDYSAKDGKIESITVLNNNKKIEIPCENLVLAIGHSSRETFRMLFDKGIKMQPKPFAVGVRAQHLQSAIDKAQYGENYRQKYGDNLPAADYKLTAKTDDGHAVYSFCMCPGGYVVNSSSEPGMLCVNGMSYSGRDGINANSAIVVSIRPEDIAGENEITDDPLLVLEFQRELEKAAFDAANGKIPTQRLEDFNNGKTSDKYGTVQPQVKGNTQLCDINAILPDFICNDLKEAFKKFGRVINGFDDPDTLLSAVESRTSSPVRINRNEDFQCDIEGIYPCGEGAGYAGGITSSAIDGIKVFEAISTRYRPQC